MDRLAPDRQKGIGPAFLGMDSQIAALGRRRNLVDLLPRGIFRLLRRLCLLARLGGGIGRLLERASSIQPALATSRQPSVNL